MFLKHARAVAAAVVALFAVTGLAYGESTRQLTLGVFGGPSIAKIRGSDMSGSLSDLKLGSLADEFDLTITDPSGTVRIDDVTLEPLKSRTGVSIGAFLNVPITDVFSVQPEVCYVAKGSKQDLRFDTTIDPGGLDLQVPLTVNLEYQLDYVEIPLLMKARIPVQGALSPSVLAGPVLALRSSSKVELSVADVGESFDIGSIVKSTDLGLVLGAGLDYGLSPKTVLNIDARYNIGMSELLDVPDIVAQYLPDLKNSAFGIRVAVGYRLGGI